MRLFFAYWPSPEKAAEISEWVRQAHTMFGGRMMRTDTLHMTLAFLGKTSEAEMQDLVEACRGWSLPSGEMVLREPGCFRNAKVVWLGPGSTGTTESTHVGAPPGLDWLYEAHDRLWGHLNGLGWPLPHSPFRPHVSLLRNAAPPNVEALQGPPIPWKAQRCVLVGSQPSETGSRYTLLAEIPLTD